MHTPKNQIPQEVWGQPDLGARFGATIARPDGDDWFAATEVFGPGLGRAIDEHAQFRRTSDRRVASSLLFSTFATRITGPLLASAWLGTGEFAPRLEHLSLRFRGGTIVETAVSAEGLIPGPMLNSLDSIFEPALGATRAAARASPVVLWGAVAAAFSSAARVLSWQASAAHDAWVTKATELIDADPRLAGKAVHEVVQSHDSPWHAWHRTTCCLAYRTEKAAYCATCCLIKPDERRRRLEASIEAFSPSSPA